MSIIDLTPIQQLHIVHARRLLKKDNILVDRFSDGQLLIVYSIAENKKGKLEIHYRSDKGENQAHHPVASMVGNQCFLYVDDNDWQAHLRRIK